MIPVILSGGNGTRLWPLSRQHHPKQFLKLVGEHTLFQQTLLRVNADWAKPPLIVCNAEHRFLVQEQLASIGRNYHSLVLEPFGRNTAPAVAMAALTLLNEGADELMLVLPADHVIFNPAAFHDALKQAATVADAGDMVLFGITPDKPETGYGYIKTCAVNAGGHEALPVERFVEKPDYPTACAFIAEGGYVWNSGMFLFKASQYLEELKRHEPDIYDTCVLALQRGKHEAKCHFVDADTFAFCPENSVDYAVLERTERASVIPLSVGWSDVGSWSSLWEVHDKDEAGNVMKGDAHSFDCKNCFVASENKLITLLGVEELVVVETKDALMVAAKERVQEVKSVVHTLNASSRKETKSHREVYRPWGVYDSVVVGNRFQVKHITVKPGASLSLQKHHHRAEHWVVVKGTAEVTCDDKIFLLTENQSTYIPIGAVHRLSNPGKIPLEIIEVQSGTYLDEDDIVRLDDVYGRSESQRVDNAEEREAEVIVSS